MDFKKFVADNWRFYLFFIVYSIALIIVVGKTADHNGFVITCSKIGFVPLNNGTCMPKLEYDNLVASLNPNNQDEAIQEFLKNKGEYHG
jgi:hypothetical protein